ncbi:MAG: BBP7 family outer membrane beta-barrel protein, partial [Novipirellula sp. JB048]
MSPRLLIVAFLWCALVWFDPLAPRATWAQGGGYAAGPNSTLNPPAGFDPYASQGLAGGSMWGGPGAPGFAPGGGFMPLGQGIRDRLWVRGEYLYWDVDGMETPPLLTTSPEKTPQPEAGVLGEPGTAVLFGGGQLNEGGQSGFRLQGGFWLTPQGSFAIEGEYFELLGSDDSFSAAGEGAPILARPFFDTVNDRESARLISYPGAVHGGVAISSDTGLRSALLNARVALVP